MNKFLRCLRVFSVGRGARAMLSFGFSMVSPLLRNQKPAEAGLGLVDKHVVKRELDPVAR